MDKLTYLSNKSVQNFIAWLSSKIDDDYSHSWFSLGASKGFKIGELWSCVGFYNAHQQYKWKSIRYDNNQNITTYCETRDYLSGLSIKLRNAIKNNDSDACKSLCIEILKWGGVDKDNIAQNIKKLDDDLAGYLLAVKNFLNSPSLDSEIEFEYQSKNGEVYSLNLDSGTTKIYSLIAKNFIIYDSRVGAALGMLVREWSQESSVNHLIPKELMFTWGGAIKKVNGINIETRNPNNGVRPAMLNFGRASSLKRFSDNVQSSWLLSKLLENDNRCGKFIDIPKESRIHAFESALFMLGYAVSERALLEMENRFINKLPSNQKSDNTKIGSDKKKNTANHDKLLSLVQGSSTRKVNPKANDIREYVVKLITKNLEESDVFEFTSSKVKEVIGGDLTAICSALKKKNFFDQRNIAIEVINEPNSGLGSVTYQTSQMT